ncbi:MAG: TIGR03435 family protein [Acidobacteriaceae bacterium]
MCGSCPDNAFGNWACGGRRCWEWHAYWRTHKIHWSAPGIPFPMIVSWIAQQPEVGGRTIVDRTGLHGKYDCHVSWALEDTGAPGPSFFTAVHEQMGLELRQRRGPVETIFVDHIEQPSPN